MITASATRPVHVLIVCMGNICRSPMAHGVVRQRLRERELLSRIRVDSAGTHGYHEGAAPDSRAQEATRRRGVDISDLEARIVTSEDLVSFDVILAMDTANLEHLRSLATDATGDKLHLFMDFALGVTDRSVPDPYYGGPIGFERVLDMVEEAVDALLVRLETLAQESR